MKKLYFLAALFLSCFALGHAANANLGLLQTSATTGNVVVDEGGGGGCTSLDNTVAEVVMDLDATCADSYTSGQTWANLVTGGSAYDHYLGSTSGSDANDPTFTGTAGDSAAYFAHDGGDYFTLVGTNTALIQTIGGKGVGGWTVCWKGYLVDGEIGVAGTKGKSSGDSGFYIRIHSDNYVSYYYRQPYANKLVITPNETTDSATNYVCVGADNDSSARIWVNSTTADEKSHSFNIGGDDGEYKLELGTKGNGGDPFVNGIQSKAFVIIDKFATNSDISAIVDEWANRH